MRALALLLCLVWGSAWAVTRYIDPDCTAFNGDGTTQACAPTNQDMDYNDYYGNALGARRNDGSFGIVTGANDLAVDPQFVGGSTPTTAAHVRLKSTSPLRRAGKDLNIGTYQDGLGRGYLHPPSIGGLEATSGDARINKTARQ